MLDKLMKKFDDQFFAIISILFFCVGFSGILLIENYPTAFIVVECISLPLCLFTFFLWIISSCYIDDPKARAELEREYREHPERFYDEV